MIRNNYYKLLAGLMIGLMAPALMADLISDLTSEKSESGRTCFTDQVCWDWQLQSVSEYDAELRVTLPEREAAMVYSFDRFELRFCEGKEDNCAMTGVFIYELPDSKAKLLVLSGHSGAHSQKLYLFSPLKQNTPVASVSGAYYVSHQMTKAGLLIRYDDCRGVECEERSRLITDVEL